MQGDKDQDRALRAFLLGDFLADADREQGPAGMPQRLGDDLDDFLRNMGYSPAQREAMRRGTPRPQDEKKYRATNAKRFKWHLDRLLPGRPAAEIAGLVAAWVTVTNCDLDFAQRWWAAGVDPASPDQLAEAIASGFRVEDLGKVVHGRTVAGHLQAGNSLRWCMLALKISRRGRSA